MVNPFHLHSSWPELSPVAPNFSSKEMAQCPGTEELGALSSLGSVGKVSACNAGDPFRFLGREDPLEKG